MRLVPVLFGLLLLVPLACTPKVASPKPEASKPTEQELKSLGDAMEKLQVELGNVKSAALDDILGKEKAEEVRTNVSKLLWEFENAPTEGQKLAAAWQINFVGVLASLPKEFGTHPQLPSLEEFEAAVTAAREFAKKYADAAKDFERNLDPKERAFITQANPLSPVRHGGYLSITPGTTVSEPEYEKLKNKMGLEALYKQAGAWFVLPAVYDDEFRPGYFKKAIELLETSDKYASVRETLIVHYQASVKLWSDPNSPELDERRKNRIAQAEAVLIENGIAKNAIPKYLDQLVKIAPNNLASMNIPFYKRVKKDANALQAKQLSGLVQKKWKAEGVMPTSLDGLSLSREQSMDVYGNDFEIVKKDKTLNIRSSGEDFEPGTEDDVWIPIPAP